MSAFHKIYFLAEVLSRVNFFFGALPKTTVPAGFTRVHDKENSYFDQTAGDAWITDRIPQISVLVKPFELV